MARRENKQKVNKYFDYNLLFLVIFLLCFGLVMLYSSSAYIAGNRLIKTTDSMQVLRNNEWFDVIFATALAEDGIGLAVMNRMFKSAGYNIREIK